MINSLLIILVLFGGAVGCTSKKEAPSDPKQALVDQGRRIYLTACIACHSPDPKKDGAIGPAVYGSSLELLEARILHATYPPGYTPKRNTKAMAALPHLKDQLPALEAYLNSN